MHPSLRRLVGAAVAILIVCLVLTEVADAPGLAIALPATLAIVGLPGVLVARAILGPANVENVTLLTAGIGAGFAILAIGGFLLHLTATGITTGSWVVGLALVSIAAASVWDRQDFVKRRLRETRDVTPDLDAEPPPVPRSRRSHPLRLFRRPDLVLLIAAVMVTGTSIQIARAGLANQTQHGFTQLWALDATDSGDLQFGIHNAEGRPEVYRLKVTRGSLVLVEWPGIQLESDASFTATITIAAGSAPIEARLYRADEPTVVYRSVTHWPRG